MSEVELKSSSGVKISVQNEEGSKTLVFDRNVRIISLQEAEAARIGAALYKSGNAVISPTLVDLIATGFFDQKKSFKEVREAMKALNPHTKPSSLTMALGAMCEKRLLVRTGPKGKYAYQKS